MLVSLVEVDADGQPDGSTVIPFIDGGTEGFKGQARMFFPMFSACYECSVGTLPPAPKGFAMCTLASVPRLPEHCIAFAREKLWNLLQSFTSATQYEMYAPKQPGDEFEPCAVSFDADNSEHMSWVFARACERAKQFNIQGVTYSLTMQVTKNIIPAIASTNALISAVCVNEALKFRSMSSMMLNNYMMYFGNAGVYSNTFEYERNPDCVVCGTKVIVYELDRQNELAALLDKLRMDPRLYVAFLILFFQIGFSSFMIFQKVEESQYYLRWPCCLHVK
jgi:ubiquitin-activating enzyme E1 C